MRSHRSTTFWNAVFIYLAIALTMVSGFVLPPLYLRYIPADLYGAWLATGNLLGWLTALDPGLSAALQQRIGHTYGERQGYGVGRWIGAGIVISGCIGLFILAVGIAVESPLLGLLELPAEVEMDTLHKAFTLAIISTALTMASYSFSAMASGLQGTFATGLIQVFFTAGSIALTVFFLFEGDGIIAIAKGMMFRAAGWFLGSGAYLLWRVRRENIKIIFSYEKLRELGRLTGFTSLGRLGGTVINHMDNFVITRYLGTETTVAFDLTRRAPAGARPIIQRLSSAVMPSVSNLDGQGKQEKLARVLSRMLRVMGWALGLFIAGFASLNNSFVKVWVGPQYFAGHTINLLILVGLSLAMLVAIFSNLCMALGNIEGNSVARLIESLVFAGAVYIGVKTLGLIGVVIAPIVAKLTVGVWYYPRAFARLVHLEQGAFRHLGKEVIKAMLVGGALSILFYRWSIETWAGLMAAASLLTAAYVVGVGLISKDFRRELLAIKGYLGKKFSKC